VLRHIHHSGIQLLILLLITFGVILLVELTGLVDTRPSAERSRVGRQDLPDFRTFPTVEAKKANFFGYLRPIARAENQKLRRLRAEVKALVAELREGEELAEREWGRIRELAGRYRVDLGAGTRLEVAEALLRRVDVVPASLVLAQAAKESAWGTSRFAREGNNLFGQWCFSAGCGMVPARRESGKSHEVETFDSVRASVASYMQNLNSHPRYEQLRAIRARLREQGQPVTGLALAEGLEHYSEQGQKYVNEIQAMIRRNDLGRVDHGS
jgi:Bax protein